MRYAADHVHAEIERALQVAKAVGRAQQAILREGHQLQIEVGRDALPYLKQGLHGQQAEVAGVHMRTNGQQTTGHRPVAVAQGALDDSVVGQLGLEFPPQGNAFEQRAAFVHAWLAIGQGRIEMEMRIDERRAEQQPLGVERFVRGGSQPFGHFGDAAVLDGDGHAGAAIGQRGVANKQVKHGTAARW